MAAAVSAWAKPGAWALDSEDLEAELQQQKQEESFIGNHHSNGGDTAALADFPSLATAASTKAKKKKPQTLSLQEFSTYASVKQAQSSQAGSKGLTAEDLMVLPTGPRQRTAEELDRSKLGGGFRSYGTNGYGSYDRSSSRVSSDEPRRQGGFNWDSNREFEPSRADEIDDWAKAKKSTVGNGFERRERGERGGFFSDSQSRADDSESWVSNKSFVPSEGRRFCATGGGGASDNWGRKREEEGRRFGAASSAFDSIRERRGGQETALNANSDNWGKKREEGSGGTRPRLNLQPRSLPVGDGQQIGTESVMKPKGSNPFGDARPREEVLKEKGKDWKETEEKLESMKIKDGGLTDGQSFGKRSFGSGSGRLSSPEDRTEKSWRKTDSVDVRPQSAENIESGLPDEAEN
ncbi:unnamed protein product [Ilex paraguariensis]|uniref:Eukaryotic translation initiation factor 4B3 n=1 Tax=Ilex paraguariensis TaxID=185542 RepID=A0ABC8SES4_9AQUA